MSMVSMVSSSAPASVGATRTSATRAASLIGAKYTLGAMAEASEITIGSVLGGTYKVTLLLGRGGMGTVWMADHLRLPGKRVAVKVLQASSQNDESYARFRREAEIATRIGHPNIV